MCVSDAGGPSAAEFVGGKFACQPSSCQLAGTINGTDLIMSFALGKQYAFANGSTFDVDFGTSGHLHLKLASTVPNGGAGSASGTLAMPMESPILPGHTVCAGDGTHFQPVLVVGRSSGVNFILRCLADSCSAVGAIDGEIDGCCMP
jgi:hypothetical protein